MDSYRIGPDQRSEGAEEWVESQKERVKNG